MRNKPLYEIQVSQAIPLGNNLQVYVSFNPRIADWHLQVQPGTLCTSSTPPSLTGQLCRPGRALEECSCDQESNHSSPWLGSSGSHCHQAHACSQLPGCFWVAFSCSLCQSPWVDRSELTQSIQTSICSRTSAILGVMQWLHDLPQMKGVQFFVANRGKPLCRATIMLSS